MSRKRNYNKLSDFDKLEIYYKEYGSNSKILIDHILFKFYEIRQMILNQTITKETAYDTISIYAIQEMDKFILNMALKDVELFPEDAFLENNCNTETT